MFSWFYVLNLKQKRDQDGRFNVTAIAQKCSKGQSLNTAYLAEWLNLSVDRPANLYKFDINEAKKRLIASPLIAQANLKKIFPNTLFIEYETREPIAYLDDFKNTSVDKQGFLFPFKPFFTPKKLPKIYLGISSSDNLAEVNGSALLSWGKSLTEYRLEIALKIYQLLMRYNSTGRTEIIRIDTSKAFDLSYGQREVVVVLEELITYDFKNTAQIIRKPVMLRLSAKRYLQEMANYNVLRNQLFRGGDPEAQKSKASVNVIDLRVPDLAFVQEAL